jgi:hypothetical protein
MAAWVRYSRGRLVYPGRITRAPFVRWTARSDGRATIEEAASLTRFSLLGRRRSAMRRLWRQLADAARDKSVIAIVEDEARAYLERLSQLAFADALPRRGVDLRRLIVVPHALVNGAAYTAIKTRLDSHYAFGSLEGGKALREFFIRTLIRDMQAAAESAHPSPSRPLAAGDGWITVGVNATFAWLMPVFEEPPWNGHHYVLELTRSPITRAVRKAVAARVEQLEGSLQTLSRAERSEIMRRAAFGV